MMVLLTLKDICMDEPGKVILGSGMYHTYNGIAVTHGTCAIWMYVHGMYTYGTII